MTDKAALLDLDGTLLLSNEAHARSFHLAARDLGLESPGVAEILRMVGMGGDKLIPRAFGFEQESSEGKELSNRKKEIFRQSFGDGLQPTPGSRDLLERLREEGFRLIIATSASGDDLSLLLGRAGVEDLVDGCTSSTDVEESKPDPDIVEAALEEAGVEAGRAIMLGDTPYDVEAAARAGVTIVGVETGGWRPDDLAGAVAIYRHPAEILDQYPQTPFGRL